MVDIYLHKLVDPSSETEAAKYLYDICQNELKDYEGKVWIVPSIHLNQGTGRHDIDILVMGYLETSYPLYAFQTNPKVKISSFCTTIEVKSHGGDGIIKDGTRLKVKYSEKQSDVNKQSEDQKNSLIKFFENKLYFRKKPYVTNLIWLRGIQDDDYQAIASDNSLPSAPTLEDIFVAIAKQNNLKYDIIAAFHGYSVSEIEDVADLFCAKVSGADTMSLRKINAIQQSTTSKIKVDNLSNGITVLSGHAGTGKTIMLLQAADILSRKGKNCLFLTYNTALISDIKHALSFLPSIRNLRDTIKFESMYSLFISLLYNNGLWNNNSNIETDFLPTASSLCRRNTIKSNLKHYDYVFIDEAQDWEKVLVEVVKKVFADARLVIADGVDQFMKASECPSWGIPSLPKLTKCLRQRYNLTLFTKIFASKMGVSWDVIPNSDLSGGKVIITNNFNKTMFQELQDQLYSHDCKNYDIMFLAPNSLVENGKFKLADAYKKEGINLFDGVDKATRDTEYGTKNQGNKECRVYTYESCRGLEAWTTICLRFGELFDKEHYHDYKEIPYEPARNYMLTLWSLIPLTRAIDTLVITIDPSSKVFPVLEAIAAENKGFIELRMV